MHYLITQFDLTDLEQNDYAKQVSMLNEKLQEEGCNLLIHSDQLEFFVYGLEDKLVIPVRKICQAFTQYSKDVVHAQFVFDIFDRDEVEYSGNFSDEFVQALKTAEGR